MPLDIEDFDNGKRDLEFMAALATSDELTAVNRLGKERRTMAGLEAEYPNAKANSIEAAGNAAIATASADQAADSAAQAAAASVGRPSVAIALADASIPVGTSFTAPMVDGSLQAYVKTSTTVATALGAPFATSSQVKALGAKLDRTCGQIPVPEGLEAAAAVINQDREIYAPLVNSAGQHIGITREGKAVERIPTESELPGTNEAVGLQTGLYAAAVVNRETGLAAPFMKRGGALVSRNEATGAIDNVLTDGDRVAPSYFAQGYTDYVTQDVIHSDDDWLATWFIFICRGQSNALGHTGPATGAATPIYAGNAWMFSTGPERNDQDGIALVPLAETGASGETCLSSWANHFIQAMNSARGVMPNVLAFTAAQGSMPYMALKRGTYSHTAFRKALRDAITAIKAKGGTRIIPVFDWMAGESDADKVNDITPTRYLRQLQQMQRHAAADIMARTLGMERPIFLVDQIAYTPGADVWEQPVRCAAVLADGVDDMRLAGPIYQHPFVASGGDGIHLNSLGENRRGQTLARATVAELFGTGWRGVKPVTWYWANSTSFVIEFDCMTPPLVLDTSGLFVSTAGLSNHGFNFDDGSGAPPAITSVVAAARHVTVTLAAAPAGKRPRWSYAMRRNAGNTTQDGPVIGARGTLRDSTAHLSLYDGVANSNWAPAFSADLPPL